MYYFSLKWKGQMWIIDQGKLSQVEGCELNEKGQLPENVFKPSGAKEQLDATYSESNNMVFFQSSSHTWWATDPMGTWTEMEPLKEANCRKDFF